MGMLLRGNRAGLMPQQWPEEDEINWFELFLSKSSFRLFIPMEEFALNFLSVCLPRLQMCRYED
jgi:hypothetical protein